MAETKPAAPDARPASGAEKRVLASLGLLTFGLALVITAITTYMPLLARQFTSSTAVIGLVIAAEGAVALMVPVVAGAWSDQLKTPIGGRLPFVLFGAPAIGLAVALRGLHAVVVAARARRVPVLHRLLRGVPSPIARGTRTS